VLGAAFCLAVLTDRAAGVGTPSVRDLSDLEARSQTELNSVVSSLRVTVNQLVTALHAIVLNLLKKVLLLSDADDAALHHITYVTTLFSVSSRQLRVRGIVRGALTADLLHGRTRASGCCSGCLPLWR
jgi:hypothetical protein